MGRTTTKTSSRKTGRARAQRARAATAPPAPSLTPRSEAPASNEHLEDSLRRFESVLDNCPAVIYIKDPEHRFLYVNRRCEEVFHIDRRTFLGQTHYDLFPKDCADVLSANSRQVLQTGVPLQAEECVPQEDGIHTYLSNRFPIFDRTGKACAVCGISLDITGQKQAEEELARHREQLAELVDERTDELMRVNELLQLEVTHRRRAQERLSALLSLAGRLNSAVTLEQAGRLIVSVADQLIGWDACMLVLCAPETSELCRILAIDTIEGRRQEVPLPREGPPPGPIVQRVFREGAKLILRDPSGPPADSAAEFLPFGDTARHSASLMFVPIRHGTAPIGMLTIQSYEPQAYSSDDLATLQALADHCGGAMERIHAAEALRNSETRYRLVARATNDAIWDWDLVTQRVSWSEGLQELFGYAADEARDTVDWWLERIHPDERAAVHAGISAAIETGSPFWSGEYRFRCRDGSYSLVIDRGYVLRDDQGRPVRMVGAMLDVTARRRAEDALRESEAKWRSLIENAPDFIFSVDREGRFLFGNRTVPPLTVEKVLGTTVYEYLPPQYHELVRESISSVFETGQPVGYEVPSIGAGGQTAWYKSRLGPIWRDGRVAAITLVATDITDRMRSEEALRASEELNRRIIDTMMGGIVQVAPDGAIVRCNAHAQRILGLSHDELTRRYLQDFAAATIWEDGTPCRVEDYPVSKCLRTGQTQTGVTIGVRRRDGTLSWAVYSAVPLRDPVSGQLSGAVVSFLDITERKQMEEHLRRSQKLEAVGVLAAGVAHDFNNMLMVIIGNAELALKGIRDSKHRQLLREVVGAAERAHQLTRQLLALGRHQPSAPEPLDLMQMLNSLGPMLGSILGPDIRVDLLTDEQVGLVRADRGNLERVIVNLAINARDAMPNGGVLSIRVARLADGDAPGIAPPGRYVRLSIQDTGLGLSPEAEKHIFEPFFSTKPVGKGTGLGLAIVHSFIQQCGGYIAYESRVGEGTTFHIYLPCAEETILPY